MSRISARFAQGKQLVPYVMAGDPDLSSSAAIISTLVGRGCSVVEIGVPYSDPLADGPTIQKSAEKALANGVTTDDVFNMISELRQKADFSPVLMIYYNLIYHYGLEHFAHRAAASGVEGVIVPDLSMEEAEEWRQAASRHALDTIFLVAPTSSDERIELLAKAGGGFLYCVSLTGVTGARTELPANLVGFLSKVRKQAKLPMAVGFGISEPGQVKQLLNFADGVVVGSAFVDRIDRAPNIEQALADVAALADSLIEALRQEA